jgi:hypothetical protein
VFDSGAKNTTTSTHFKGFGRKTKNPSSHHRTRVTTFLRHEPEPIRIKRQEEERDVMKSILDFLVKGVSEQW